MLSVFSRNVGVDKKDSALAEENRKSKNVMIKLERDR